MVKLHKHMTPSHSWSIFWQQPKRNKKQRREETERVAMKKQRHNIKHIFLAPPAMFIIAFCLCPTAMLRSAAVRPLERRDQKNTKCGTSDWCMHRNNNQEQFVHFRTLKIIFCLSTFTHFCCVSIFLWTFFNLTCKCRMIETLTPMSFWIWKYRLIGYNFTHSMAKCAQLFKIKGIFLSKHWKLAIFLP